MNCPKCHNDAVENTVLGKTFYYCRTCKDEVASGSVSTNWMEETILHHHGLGISTPVQSPQLPFVHSMWLTPGRYELTFTALEIRAAPINHFPGHSDWVELHETARLEGTSMRDLTIVPVVNGQNIPSSTASSPPAAPPTHSGSNPALDKLARFMKQAWGNDDDDEDE